MKTTEVKLRRKDGEWVVFALKINVINDDRHRFSREEAEEVPALYRFNHQQQHSRLDLSNLDDHLLISFDKNDQLVGVTYCKHTADGPFEVHNKQRTFLLVRRSGDLDPTAFTSIEL